MSEIGLASRDLANRGRVGRFLSNPEGEGVKLVPMSAESVHHRHWVTPGPSSTLTATAAQNDSGLSRTHFSWQGLPVTAVTQNSDHPEARIAFQTSGS